MSNQIVVGNIVEGTIGKIKPFGALVNLPEDAHGLVHISHISSSYVEDIANHVSVGDTVTVKILSIEEGTGKIALSMKEVAPKSQAPKEMPKTVKIPKEASDQFEDKFKDFMKSSNERLAGLNKRNKRR